MPAKTVGKFRCLLKTWLTRLTTSHFINLHLSHNTNQQSLILLTKTNSLHKIKPPIFENSKNLELGNGNSCTELLGSCNGLVLLLNEEKEMFLVNPTTLEQFKVPFFEFGWCGFGYDSFTHDYKIVTIYMYQFGGIIHVDVYSVKLGVWKRINHSLTAFFGLGSSYGVFINGSVNWFISNKSRVLFTILAFNLATEVFNEIDIPLNVKNGPRCPDGSGRKFAYEGCLCTIVPLLSGAKRTEDIWMMKEYGKVNSWTKLASLDGNGKWWIRVPLWIGIEEIVLIAFEELSDEDIAEDETMVVYNLEEGTVKEMVVNGAVASFRDGLSFVDSLVSLKEFTSSS